MIGRYGWRSRGGIILPGVAIGKACVIGAGSIVTKDVKSYTVVGGNSAINLRQRNQQLQRPPDPDRLYSDTKFHNGHREWSQVLLSKNT